MLTKIVEKRDSSALISGLTWMSITEKETKSPKDIRKHLADLDAKKIIVTSKNGVGALGYSISNIEDDDNLLEDEEIKNKVKIRNYYSIASIFAEYIGDGNAVFAYQFPNSSFVCVILTEAGRPVLDVVKTADEAQAMVVNYSNGNTGFAYSVYTNNLELFSNGEYVSNDKIWEGINKEALLINKPINKTGIILLISVIFIASAVSYGGKIYYKQQKLKADIAAQKAKDPVPKYLLKLNEVKGSLGASAEVVNSAVKYLGKQVLRDSGWSLTNIECVTQNNICVSNWIREGGTTKDLIASRIKFNEEYIDNGLMDQANFSIKMDMKTSGISSREDLPEEKNDLFSTLPIFQTIDNSGVKMMINRDGYRVWPVVPAIAMKDLPPSVVVKARDIDFVTSLVLYEQIILLLPKNYWWNSFKLAISSSTDSALSVVNISLKGTSYVR